MSQVLQILTLRQAHCPSGGTCGHRLNRPENPRGAAPCRRTLSFPWFHPQGQLPAHSGRPYLEGSGPAPFGPPELGESHESRGKLLLQSESPTAVFVCRGETGPGLGQSLGPLPELLTGRDLLRGARVPRPGVFSKDQLPVPFEHFHALFTNPFISSPCAFRMPRMTGQIALSPRFTQSPLQIMLNSPYFAGSWIVSLLGINLALKTL